MILCCVRVCVERRAQRIMRKKSRKPSPQPSTRRGHSFMLIARGHAFSFSLYSLSTRSLWLLLLYCKYTILYEDCTYVCESYCTYISPSIFFLEIDCTLSHKLLPIQFVLLLIALRSFEVLKRIKAIDAGDMERSRKIETNRPKSTFCSWHFESSQIHFFFLSCSARKRSGPTMMIDGWERGFSLNYYSHGVCRR